MTRGKLLGNNAPLFIFISILIMTQLISFLHCLLTAVRTGRLGLLPIKIYWGNNAVFVSVDLIGETKQVILEFRFNSRQINDTKMKSLLTVSNSRISIARILFSRTFTIDKWHENKILASNFQCKDYRTRDDKLRKSPEYCIGRNIRCVLISTWSSSDRKCKYQWKPDI